MMLEKMSYFKTHKINRSIEKKDFIDILNQYSTVKGLVGIANKNAWWTNSKFYIWHIYSLRK